MARVEDQDINQTIRAEGVLDGKKVNEAFRKLSEWWSRLKAAVKFESDGGGVFTAFSGDADEPSYSFKNASQTGLWLDDETSDMHYSQDGLDYGIISGNGYLADLVKSSGTGLLNNTLTPITWSTVGDYNRGGIFNPALSTRLNIPVQGFYLITTSLRIAPGSSGNYFSLRLYRNGAADSDEVRHNGFAATVGLTLNTIKWAVPGDYFEIKAIQNTGSSVGIYGGTCQIMRVG
jgi:hypothetical protein